MNSLLKSKIKKIKLISTDVDGVLTDGGMYYTKDGDVMKKFHARDGMGVTLLLNHGIPTIIITKEKTRMVKQWSKKMNVTHLFDGVKNKEQILDIIYKKYNVKAENIAYIGDDVNDFKILSKVGLAVSPHDSIEQIKKISHYITKSNSGKGVFREIADLILSIRFGDTKKSF